MTWYEASDTPELVEFGPVRGLAVTGQGEPGGAAYNISVQALYTVFGFTGAPIPPLEGRWWVEDDRPGLEVPREEWHWHLFLRLPETADPTAAIEQARESVRAAARVQHVTFTEGKCIQLLHHGSFEDEPKSLALMDDFMRRSGLIPNGLHHEIYLSDLRQTAPADLRTILRQPVRPA